MTIPRREQAKLAERLGVDISRDSESMAAARLLDAVSEAVGLPPSEPSTKSQQSFAKSLGEDISKESKRVASAIIGDALFTHNQARLKELKLKPEDRVIRTDRFEHGGIIREVEKEFVVSSIHPSGRIYFKGGKGEGAWPTQVRKLSANKAFNSDAGKAGAS